MKMQERTLLREVHGKAHHQAGYAVACMYLGLRFHEITIRRKNETLIHGRRGGDTEREAGTLVSEGLCFLAGEPLHPIARFAGQVAERQFVGRRLMHLSTTNDQRVADEEFHCGWFSSSTKRAYLHYCWCAAEDVVRQRWRDVEAVATQLMKAKVLRENDVREIVFRRGEANENK